MRAIRRRPVTAQEVLIVASHHPLIGGNDNSHWRIETMGQLVERNISSPFAFISRSIIRNTTVAALADRNFPRAVITDMTLDIRVDKILCRTGVVAQRFSEFFPVVSPVGIEESG